MAVKYIYLAVLCAAFLFSCQGGWITWVKLNTSPVCFGAKHNKYGAFTPGQNAFIWAFMLKHRSGHVTCNVHSGSQRKSAWGCSPNHKDILTFLTDDRNIIIGPRFSQPMSQSYYHLPGYLSSSPYLIFFMGKSAYGLHHMAELRLWYGEDLVNVSESDNGGTSCADVYGLMYKS